MAVCACIVLTPALAAAQAVRLGPTFSLGGTTSPVILPDVAHDPSTTGGCRLPVTGSSKGTSSMATAG